MLSGNLYLYSPILPGSSHSYALGLWPLYWDPCKPVFLDEPCEIKSKWKQFTPLENASFLCRL
jgi:hypothetical protein